MTTVGLTLTPATGSPALGDSPEAARAVCVPLEAAVNERLVGGKASALGRMIRAGIAVPDGIVLTVHALDAHLARLASVSTDFVPQVRSTPMPMLVREQLLVQAAPLLARGPVVVRSSAVGEDGATESFAGQLDSILGVANQVGLERAVREVWSSLWSPRVTAYREARGAAMRGMGVVIQQQVDARVAGVMFTITSSGEMLVEYGAGLADKLVTGEVDPGRLAIDRVIRTSRVLTRSDQCWLSDREIEHLRATGLALEAELGAPQDVEWAIDQGGALYAVQSRPITAPVTMPAEQPGAAKRRVAWSNANVNENFPRPISPLLYSIALTGYTHYFRNLAVACGVARDRVRAMEPAFQRIIGVHGARMYYNLTSIHSVLRMAPFGEALTRSFDAFVGADGRAVEGADGGSVETTAVARRGKPRQIAELSVIATRAAVLLSQLERRIGRFERTVDELAVRAEPSRLDRLTLIELRELLATFIEIRCHKWLDASLADGAAMISYGALERLLRGAGVGGAAHTSLLKAIPDVVSGEPVLRLWDLSRMVRTNDALVALFDSPDATAVLDVIRAEPRFAEFHAAFQRFLDEWGFRCSEELMLTTPSFQEGPAPLVDVLRAYVHSDGESPRDALRAQAEARESETRTVARRLGPARRVLLNLLLPRVHAAIRYRERARLKQALLYSRCRRIALAMGAELARRGVIAERDDVFLLTWHEVLELTNSRGTGGGRGAGAGTGEEIGGALPGAVRVLVAARKAEHARLAAMTPPDSFTLPEGEQYEGGHADVTQPPTLANDALVGTSACGGRVTGRATVLESATQSARLTRGDVLVTKQTDPGWGPVFPLISGLVIERGGMLSHGAIIAREFGIPCVVGVRDAMRRIPPGATVMVDGDRGAVHVIA